VGRKTATAQTEERRQKAKLHLAARRQPAAKAAWHRAEGKRTSALRAKRASVSGGRVKRACTAAAPRCKTASGGEEEAGAEDASDRYPCRHLPATAAASVESAAKTELEQAASLINAGVWRENL